MTSKSPIEIDDGSGPRPRLRQHATLCKEAAFTLLAELPGAYQPRHPQLMKESSAVGYLPFDFMSASAVDRQFHRKSIDEQARELGNLVERYEP